MTNIQDEMHTAYRTQTEYEAHKTHYPTSPLVWPVFTTGITHVYRSPGAVQERYWILEDEICLIYSHISIKSQKFGRSAQAMLESRLQVLLYQ